MTEPRPTLSSLSAAAARSLLRLSWTAARVAALLWLAVLLASLL
jgi:hypothetical protein